MAHDSLSIADIELGTGTWVAVLVPTLAVYESGTLKGRTLAKQNLQRMAELADLAHNAVKTIERMLADEHVRGDDVCLVMAEARRLSHSRPADNTPDHRVAPSTAGGVARTCGVLAKRLSNLDLPLDVCYSARGFYIGTFCDAQPYTRESEEYWPRRDLAADAMRNHDWTQRVAP